MRLTSSILLCVVSLFAGCESDALINAPDQDRPQGSLGPAEVIAIAGPDLVVLEGSRVMLAGNASRALVGDPALSWSQREGPPVVLSNPSSSSPVFLAPLAPARLVFALEATTENRRDLDAVVVEVVDHASLVPALPAALTLPGDRAQEAQIELAIDEPWQGRGAAVVDVRCEADTIVAPAVVDGRLRFTIAPLQLPCPIVVDDVVDDDGSGPVGAGRAAITLWPLDVAVAPPTRVTVRAPAGDTDGPSFLDPGERVTIEVDANTRVFFADGRAIQLTASTSAPQLVEFTAPLSPGRLTLLAEGREGGTSGGLRVVALDVRSGVDNAAPVVDAGADLRVRPGARFRIVPTFSDDDGDAVTIAVTQVLGETAQQLGGGVGTLQAPSTAQTLLFHVVGNDGVVDSAADPVRVVVDAAAENQPPVLTVPAELYVVPGGTFVVDASSARDPDNGLIASTRIVQEAGDGVQLLEDPVDALRVTLTAGEAGDVYRFVLSATDDGGLETSASLTVIVEDAGPWVDVTRGRSDGNGTVERPFSSIAAAFDTAARHRFTSLLLAGGALALEALPDGLGLVGGHDFAGDDYVADGERTRLTITGAVDVAGAGLERLAITGAGGRLRLRRHVVLRDVDVAVPLDVLASANVEVGGSAVVDLDIDRASVALDDVAVVGQVRGQGATVAVRGGSITAARGPAVQVTGGALTASGIAIRGVGLGVQLGAGAIASLGGSVDVGVDGALVGGAGPIGIQVDGGSLDFAGLELRVHGGDRATGVVVGAGAAIGGLLDLTVDDAATATGIDSRTAPLGGVLSGNIRAFGASTATGLAVFAGALDRLRVTVDADAAVGISGPRVDARAVVVVVTGAAAAGVAVDAGTLRHVTIIADGTAVVGTPALALRNVVLRAPIGISGDVDVGVVGIAADDPQACPGCIVAAGAAVDADTGILASDAVLGAPNPFVDVGALADAVSFDVDGREVPQGAGPDLGAIERN